MIWSDKSLASGFSSLHGPTIDEMKSSEKHKNERKLDEWPSFDLGF